MKKLIIPLILLFFSINSQAQINFVQGEVKDVLEKAKNENKIVMVDVLTEWCKWCIELDNKVYANPEVAVFANNNQINYKIDAEIGEGKDFAKEYKITGYPTILFLDKDGKEIDRIVGYIPAKDFLEIIRDYHKGINTYNYLQSQVQNEPENALAWYKLGNKYLTLGDFNNAETGFEKVIALDPNNNNGKTDDAKLALAQMSDKEKRIEELTLFIDNNKNSDVLKDAYISLGENLYYLKDDKENSKLIFQKAIELYPNDEWLLSSYGQYKNSMAGSLADKGKSGEDYREGLTMIEEALPLVKGSVNEASSYYIQSKLYYNLKEYDKALVSVNKALEIFNRKLYREHKVKVEQQISTK